MIYHFIGNILGLEQVAHRVKLQIRRTRFEFMLWHLLALLGHVVSPLGPQFCPL